MIANMYGEALASKMGVLTHNTKFVRVFINERYSGVYGLHVRMRAFSSTRNGSRARFFIGDNLGSRWQADQFQIAGDKEDLKRVDPLKKMISAMYQPLSPKRYQELWAVLSKEKYWVAANNLRLFTRILTTTSFFIMISPGKIEPIISDILGHGAQLFPLYKYRLWQDFVPFSERDPK